MCETLGIIIKFFLNQMENYRITGDISDFVFEHIMRVPSLRLKHLQVEKLELKTKQECTTEMVDLFIDKNVRSVMLTRESRINSVSQSFCLPGVALMQWKELSFPNSTPAMNKKAVNEFLDTVKQLLYKRIQSPTGSIPSA